jgi:hypothetical protein
MTAEEHGIADMCSTKQIGTIFKTTYDACRRCMHAEEEASKNNPAY